MKREWLVCFIILISISFISASNVAFVVKNTHRIDQNFVRAFEDLDFNVDIISDKEISSTNFNNYDLIFLSKSKIRNINKIPLEEKNIVTINPYSLKETGFLTRNRVSRLSSNSFLKVLTSEGIKLVYENPNCIGRLGFSYYYLKDRYKTPQTQTVAETDGGRDSLGDVISYIEDSQTQTNKCFFGITEAGYWNSYSKKLFEDCVNFALEGEDLGDDDDEDDNGDDNQTIKDIALSLDTADSVNGIRIRDAETLNRLTSPTPKLICNREYWVDLFTVNLGNTTVDINASLTIMTSSRNKIVFNDSSIRKDLLPKASTSTGSKKINFSVNLDVQEGFVPGFYIIRAESQILGNFQDENPEDNIRERMVEVICGV